jgi:hypothetical protein
MRYLFILLFIVSLNLNTKANHIFSSFFEWNDLGNDSIELIFQVYRDCNSPVTISPTIYISSSCTTYSKTATAASKTDVTPVCNSSCSRCGSSSCAFPYGIQKETFKLIVDLSKEKKNKCCLVTFYNTTCCRSASLLNGGNTAQHIEASINLCNGDLSSVKWSNEIAQLICQGQDQSFDFSLLSDNKNHLTKYELDAPKVSTSSTITYSSNYSENSPLNYLGYPKNTLAKPRGFLLDTSKATLEFRPMNIQLAPMAITANIYQKNKVVATITREQMFVIMKCASNTPPTLSGIDCSKPTTKNFEIEVCAGTQVCFKVCSSDNDANDSVTISYNDGIDGATFKILNPNGKYQAGEFCWTPDTSDIRAEPYNMVISAFDNFCPLNASTAKTYTIKVVDADSAKVDLVSTKINDCGDYKFNLKTSNNKIPNTVHWFLNDTTEIGKGDSIAYSFDSLGGFKITGENRGCLIQKRSERIEIKRINDLEISYTDTSFCYQSSLEVSPLLKNAVKPIDYTWIPDTAIVSNQGVDSSHFIFSTRNTSGINTFYLGLNIVDSFGCSLTKEQIFSTLPSQNLSLENNKQFCEGTDTTIALKTYNNMGQWQGMGVGQNSLAINTLGMGNYQITYLAKDSLGCYSDSFNLAINPLPLVDAGADFKTCTSADTFSAKATPKGGIWSGNAIAQNGLIDPSQLTKGSTTLTYRFIDNKGCIGLDQVDVIVYDYKLNVSAPDSLLLCENGAPNKITATPKGGKWLGSGIVSFNNEIEIDPSQMGTGLDYLFYELIDSNECRGVDTTVLYITQKPLPAFTIQDSIVELGNSPVFSNSSFSENTANYLWRIIGLDTIESGDFEPNVVPDSLGYYDVSLMVTDKLRGCTDSITMNKGFKVVLGTSNKEILENELVIFPNPVHEQLYLETSAFESAQVFIYNAQGQLVLNLGITNPKAPIDVSELANGVYYLKLLDGAKSTELKFLKY